MSLHADSQHSYCIIIFQELFFSCVNLLLCNYALSSSFRVFDSYFQQKLREEFKTLNGEDAIGSSDSDEDEQKAFQAKLARKFCLYHFCINIACNLSFCDGFNTFPHFSLSLRAN